MALAAPPARIDRYEVVGRLATGGMAEVLLARLRGLHGFEQPVVIKRILPHLALEPDVVSLFLDEARTISSLRHPNLPRIHDLGRDENGLYMVMEYLEGESVAGLCRRLALRGEQLDPSVAAHIAAEVCAGLHAAHEATAPDGRPLALVHRDISPQNIIVTYSGAVHLIDFGIATSADRMTRTESGIVRGKFEYIAPEQLQAVPLDRRADIFALGIVLFEVTSGRRVYRRESPAQAIHAILSEPVPLLTDARRDVPPELAAICSRALAKAAEGRFQSAAEMRRELLAFLRQRTDEDLGEKLGRVMRGLFGDRIAEKAEMLRRVQGGDEIAALPAPEADIQVELQTISLGTPEPTRLPPMHQVANTYDRVAPTHPTLSGPRPRPRLEVWGVGFATLLLLALTIFMWRRNAVVAPVSPSIAVTTPVAPAPVSASPPADSVAAATDAPPPAAADPAAAPIVRVHVESSPSPATVTFDGIARGMTPLDVTTLEGTKPIRIEVRAAGFETGRRTVVPDADKTVKVVLLRSGRPNTSSPAVSSPILW